MIWCVVWTVLMIFWICGGGYYVHSQPNANWGGFIPSTVIPWVCVLILGLILFGGVHPGPVGGL